MHPEFLPLFVIEGERRDVMPHLAAQAIRNGLQGLYKIEMRDYGVVDFQDNSRTVCRCTDRGLSSIGFSRVLHRTPPRRQDVKKVYLSGFNYPTTSGR